jgi:hypothetical protein
MELKINLKKRHVFAILGMLALVGVVMAFGGNQPDIVGHSSGEIRMNSLTGEPNLDVWSSNVQSTISNHLTRITNLENSASTYCTSGGLNCPSMVRVWPSNHFCPGAGINGIPIAVYCGAQPMAFNVNTFDITLSTINPLLPTWDGTKYRAGSTSGADCVWVMCRG